MLIHRRTIFKTSTLEQSAEKWRFSAAVGVVRPLRPSRLAAGLVAGVDENFGNNFQKSTFSSSAESSHLRYLWRKLYV